jgi:hypothetical protein
MPHNGIDIDQFILLTIYPTAAFFVLGFLRKKFRFSEVLQYALQGGTCIVFSIVYFILIPHGGAQGLAIVLFMFGILLLFMARKNIIHQTSQ